MPNQAVNDSERELFFQFWDQALLYSLIRTKFFDENGNELPSEDIEVPLPYDYDYWILQMIAAVIFEMRQNENAMRYWEPILALGPRAEHWVERFLNHWFMDRPKNEYIDNFIYHWKSMLNYCFTSDNWIKQRSSFSYNSPKLWLNLLGFASFGGDSWKETDSEILVKIQENIVRAIPYVFRSSSCAVRMFSWLSKKSSSSIRVLLLKPIFNTITKKSDEWWQEKRLLSALANYLNILWDEHRQKIRPLRKEFEGLLAKTVTFHEPLALELQSRISSRNY